MGSRDDEVFYELYHKVRVVAQPGSVSAWGAGGRWFESSPPDEKGYPLAITFFIFLLISLSLFIESLVVSLTCTFYSFIIITSYTNNFWVRYVAW